MASAPAPALQQQTGDPESPATSADQDPPSVQRTVRAVDIFKSKRLTGNLNK